jgi:hypothetical protein
MRSILVDWASLAALWEAEGVLALLPPFCCLTLGSSEDFGLVLGGAVRVGVDVMDLNEEWIRVTGRDNRWMEVMIDYVDLATSAIDGFELKDLHCKLNQYVITGVKPLPAPACTL